MSDCAEPAGLSAECRLAREPSYKALHEECRETADIPLPYGHGILLARRCSCFCHRMRASLNPPETRYPLPTEPLRGKS